MSIFRNHLDLAHHPGSTVTAALGSPPRRATFQGTIAGSNFQSTDLNKFQIPIRLYGPKIFDTLQTGLPKRDDLDESADLEHDLEEAALAETRRRIALTTLDSANNSTKEVAQLVRQMQALVAAKKALQGETSEQSTILTNAVRTKLENFRFLKGDMAQEWL